MSIITTIFKNVLGVHFRSNTFLQKGRFRLGHWLVPDNNACHVHDVPKYFTNIAGHCIPKIHRHLDDILFIPPIPGFCCSNFCKNQSHCRKESNNYAESEKAESVF